MADPDPQGVLLVGAHPWAIDIADALQSAEVNVPLVDVEEHIAQAREHELPAQQSDVLDERAIDEISFNGLGYLVPLTSSGKVDALAALHFHEIFDSTNIFQLSTLNDGEPSEGRLPTHMRGYPLFGEDVTHAASTTGSRPARPLRALSFPIRPPSPRRPIQ